ncbi:ACT domain-containing protein [Candidatus Chlorohelix sp.]|uniref:ACT domain-containing protein n=1 Tax=Candidatus Chlorohelix sp. TaxID=3139201 RepID=UPI0030755697
MTNLKLFVIAETLAVCRLNENAPVPGWALLGGFFSVTRAHKELSVVCLQQNAPDMVKCERGWRALKVQGPLEFSMTGVLAALAVPLAQAEVSIFAISTYDTDYILVKQTVLEKAIAALREEGFEVEENS